MNLLKITSHFVFLGCLSCLVSLTALASPPHATDPDFAAIDSYVEAQMQDKRIPGLALAVVQGDQILYLKGYGNADPSGRPVTPQTPFLLASATKPMTALAVMQLVEQGKIELDAPVQRYLPWFRLADEAAAAQITVRQLLYHTSGLSIRTGLELAGIEDSDPDAIEQRVRDLETVQLVHPVGATYEYSNPNYETLGQIIQQVTGQSYEAYMQEHVFRPLAMSQTFTSKSEGDEHGLATGYRYWFGIPVPFDTPFDRGALPVCCVMASVEDVAHFLIPHLNEGRFSDVALVSPQGMAELLRPAGRKENSEEMYAMDWGHMTIDGVPMIMKGGDLADFKTQMVLVPDGRWGIVTLMNTNDSLGTTLGDLRIPFIPIGVTKILLGQQVPEAPTSAVPSIYRGIPVLIVVLLLLGMLWSIATLRRWQSSPDRRPRGFWGMAWHAGTPLVVNLGIGLVALAVVPQSLGMPMSFLLYMFPDFGYSVRAIGVIGVGWGLAWLALALFISRGAKRETPIAVPADVNA
jgi:CubicO group peptidase (beta-lactamase class C family)